MKKLMMTLTACLLATTLHASSFDGLDDVLMFMNVIDENYRYNDIETVEMIFEEAGNGLREDMLNVPGEDPQLTELTVTPYLINMKFQMSEAYNKTDRLIFQRFFARDDTVQDGCEELYTEEVFYANDFIINMIILDASQQLLGNVVLDKDTCQ